MGDVESPQWGITEHTDELIGGRTNLLKADHVRLGSSQPIQPTPTMRSANPVHIRGDHPQWHSTPFEVRHNSCVEIASGPWSADTITEFLTKAVIPIRLASTGSVGPLVQSLWFTWMEDALWCCTQADSVLASRIARDSRVGFEIAGDEPPYRGVRGRGHAEFRPDAAATLLPMLITRYLGSTDGELAAWLLSRVDSETAIRIHDLRVTSWDYTPRMA